MCTYCLETKLPAVIRKAYSTFYDTSFQNKVRDYKWPYSKL